MMTLGAYADSRGEKGDVLLLPSLSSAKADAAHNKSATNKVLIVIKDRSQFEKVCLPRVLS